MILKNIGLILSCFLLFSFTPSLAGTDGSLLGVIQDDQGIAVSAAKIEIFNLENQKINQGTTSATGEFEIFPLTFGDYKVLVQESGFIPSETRVHIASGAATRLDVSLLPLTSANQEMVIKVKAKRHLVQTSAASSEKEVTSQQIEAIPQGENVSLPHLLSSTTPGIIQGPFGQTFVRGNHANIQYQIDGVQLPDSQTNSFGDAFTPRNIDHMEVITGGIPAEYGNRLAAVINIVTKTGPEKPGGEAEVNGGSYDTFSPYLIYGGSSESGQLHYFLSTQYNKTSRGLDTPEPASESNFNSGGSSIVHDDSHAHNEFFKLDWLPNNQDKFTVIAFNSYAFYQVPNLPGTFSSSDAMFQPGYVDPFQNTNGAGQASVYTWTPSGTNDTQTQDDAYLELVSKHSFDEHTFWQNALYYKYSLVQVGNDPTNDLASAYSVPLAAPASLSENRHVNNFGLKSDFTKRLDEKNLLKAGLQLQNAQANGSLSVLSASNQNQATPITTVTSVSSVDQSTASGNNESIYIQDDYSPFKKWVINMGLRIDAFQNTFSNLPLSGSVNASDQQIQPRIGVNYFPSETTKIHAFYGRLFMPAPLEDLRDTFAQVFNGQNTQTNTVSFYDIKPEKDDYFEIGVAQQWGDQVLSLNTYYKKAYDMIDDNELLNTSLVAAYNYQDGYAYGVEFSLQGNLGAHFKDYFNYAYEIAKGEGASGGIFALPPGTQIPSGFLYLDHVQIHTLNAGLTYNPDDHWQASLLALFGSGLRTGPNNSLALPSHFTMDSTLAYDFHSDSWLSKTKVSFDVLNVFDNAYPITVANGFNASHYAAGREFFVRVTKAL